VFKVIIYIIIVLAANTCLADNTFAGNKEVSAKPFIKAAVAEGFADGLHAKYIRYLVNKLNMNLSLATMPFARRIKEIRNGNLDIIVGVQRTNDREDELIYIQPYYESLTYCFFSLKEHSNTVSQYSDLKINTIGVNKNSKYFPQFDKDQTLNKVNLITLKQKINLLIKGRIDLFIHYQESTMPTLIKMGYEDKISQTIYQPQISNKHYIAISKRSFLVNHINDLQQIMSNAVKNKDLINIRLQHYRQQPSN